MKKITEIYNKDIYDPFIQYCKDKRYKTMRDLAGFPFHLLHELPGISTLLASRIKAVYISYCKSVPAPAGDGNKKREASMGISETELVKLLCSYFRENGDRLITLNELAKLAGPRVKREQIGGILRQVPWCKAVDKSTFFYASVK